jgi:hypothetical protein
MSGSSSLAAIFGEAIDAHWRNGKGGEAWNDAQVCSRECLGDA